MLITSVKPVVICTNGLAAMANQSAKCACPYVISDHE